VREAKKGLWYAAVVDNTGQGCKVAETGRLLVDKPGAIAHWNQTVAIPVMRGAGAAERSWARHHAPSYSLQLRVRQDSKQSGGKRKGEDLRREVIWTAPLDIEEDGAGISKLSSPSWLNPASPLNAVSRLLGPPHADSSVRAVVREVGLDMRPIQHLDVGSSLGGWAGDAQVSGGALVVVPVCCEGLAESKWVRLRMTLCVGENRSEALETRWSSRVLANYSRNKPNVINRKFFPGNGHAWSWWHSRRRDPPLTPPNSTPDPHPYPPPHPRQSGPRAKWLSSRA